MAPIKFEDDIREKLQNREITPSAGAWAKLDKALEETRPPRRNYRSWWAVAAAIALIAISFPLLFQSETVPVQLVEEELKMEETVPVEPINEMEVATSEPEKVQEEPNDAVAQDEERIAQEEPQPVRTVTTNERRMPALASTIQEKQEIPSVSTPEETGQPVPTYEETKVSEVVAQVQELDRNGEVSVDEVEALLIKAQRDIANRKLLQGDVVQVDPRSLLNDVESEIERSFRDKVFEALGDGFEKVRTAVAERNN